MHQPIDDDLAKDPSHTDMCMCLRCHCFNILKIEEAKEVRDKQLAKKLEDGTPTLQDLRAMMDIDCFD